MREPNSFIQLQTEMVFPYFLKHSLPWAPSHQTLLLFLLPPATPFQSLFQIFLLFSKQNDDVPKNTSSPLAHFSSYPCMLPARLPPIPWASDTSRTVLSLEIWTSTTLSPSPFRYRRHISSSTYPQQKS